MPKKKAVEPQAAPAKKAPAKRASKPKGEVKPAKKAAPKKATATKSEKPAKSAPKRKNTKHADVANEVVLSALGSGKPSSKSELVAACGGDAVAVTKTIQRLRGLGQIVVTGNKRNTVYTKAA